MIRVIKGTVGISIDNRTEMRSPADPPFCLDEKTEARLVGLGVAQYVNAQNTEAQNTTFDAANTTYESVQNTTRRERAKTQFTEKEQKLPNNDNEQAQNNNDNEQAQILPDLMNASIKQLLKIAKQRGLIIPKASTREQIIAAITDDDNLEEVNEEDAPQIDPSELVL